MRFFLRAMVQPVQANISMGHYLRHPLHSETDKGEMEQCQSPAEGNPSPGISPSLKQVTLYQLLYYSGLPCWVRCFPLSSSSSYLFSYLYSLLLVKGYPSFISLKRYLLC